MRTSYKAGLSLFLLAVAIALPLLAPHPARAEDTPEENRTKLMQFAANNLDFDATVISAGRFIYRRQINACETIEQAVRQMPTSYGFLSFPPPKPGDATNAFPAPRSGVWAERVKIRGCGKIWQVNMLVIGRPTPLNPLIFALLPGDTLSDPANQRTAEQMGAIAISRTDATCPDTARTLYTRILGYRMPDGSMTKTDQGQGWYEEWMYSFCHKSIPTQMAFLPDNNGGYDIKARVVGVVQATPPVQKPATPDAAKPGTPDATVKDPAALLNSTR